MKRFFVFQYKNGYVYSDVFAGVNGAIAYGQMMWDHLTDSEKKKQYILSNFAILKEIKKLSKISFVKFF